MKLFAKIDLANAYNQIELDEVSREITTINTPLGLLRWTRLPFGIKTASALFQAAIEKTVFAGDCTSNIVVYQDDICIGAANEAELNEKVSCMLKKLKDAGMTVNESKCVFKTEAVDFLGYNISVNGVNLMRNLSKRWS